VGRTAKVHGLGTTNGGQSVEFDLEVTDASRNGRLDTFKVSWPGYTASGKLKAGDIEVPC
jgi:hypothetical protein